MRGLGYAQHVLPAGGIDGSLNGEGRADVYPVSKWSGLECVRPHMSLFPTANRHASAVGLTAGRATGSCEVGIS